MCSWAASSVLRASSRSGPASVVAPSEVATSAIPECTTVCFALLEVRTNGLSLCLLCCLRASLSPGCVLLCRRSLCVVSRLNRLPPIEQHTRHPSISGPGTISALRLLFANFSKGFTFMCIMHMRWTVSVGHGRAAGTSIASQGVHVDTLRGVPGRVLRIQNSNAFLFKYRIEIENIEYSKI